MFDFLLEVLADVIAGVLLIVIAKMTDKGK
ncbi:MAG: hypothetical protein ACFWTQ_11175 [Lactococcus sp.]|jgi:hypothetical protein